MKARLIVLVIAVLTATLAALALTGSTAGSTANAATTPSTPYVLSCDYSCGGGSVSGNTHCFATWGNAGCQLNHTLSTEVANYTAAGSLSAAGAVVCGAVTSGSAAIGCAWIAGAIFYGVQGHITWMPYGYCIEVGYYYFYFGPYAKLISCTVE